MGGILKSNKFIKNFLIHMELLTKKEKPQSNASIWSNIFFYIENQGLNLYIDNLKSLINILKKHE
jgi:hypothetical protein